MINLIGFNAQVRDIYYLFIYQHETSITASVPIYIYVECWFILV